MATSENNTDGEFPVEQPDDEINRDTLLPSQNDTYGDPSAVTSEKGTHGDPPLVISENSEYEDSPLVTSESRTNGDNPLVTAEDKEYGDSPLVTSGSRTCGDSLLETSELNPDEALDLVGGYRRWHIFMFFLISWTTYIAHTWQNLSVIFTGWTPPHHCSDLDADNTTTAEYGQCEITSMSNLNGTWENETSECTNGWIYDTEYNTMVTEWDLVCDKNYLVELLQMFFHVTVVTCTVPVAYMVDKCGRKNTHIAAGLLLGVCGTVAAFIPSFTVLILCRCVISVLVKCIGHSGIVMLMELYDSRRRTAIGILHEHAWVGCCVLLSLLAYLFSDWRNLQIAISVACLFFLLHVKYLVESPRWLAANSRYTEAEDALLQMAKWNNVEIKGVRLKRRLLSEETAAKMPPSTLLRDGYLRLHLIICCLMWFTNMLVYYGLTYFTPAMGSNRFIAFFVSSIIEIPAFGISFLLMKRYGRRLLMCGLHIFIGPPLVILGLLTDLPDGLAWIKLVLALMGKFGISASFGVMIVYTNELFPTNIRTTSVGVCHFIAGIGGMLAPFSTYAGKLGMMWIPNIVFAGLSVVTGLAILLLPETTDIPLPDTIKHIHNLHGKQNVKEAGQETEDDKLMTECQEKGKADKVV